jgi:tetratricopeptide (TPR) repeat protein
VPALAELDELADAPDLEKPDLKFHALLLRGEAWHRLGRHLEAQTALLAALQIDEDAVDAHRWLGASYYDLGAIHQAVHHLKRTAELDPADQRPPRLLGLIHKDYERFEEAAGFYAESLRRKNDQPDWEEVRLEMASCQVKLRRHREALESLQPCPESAESLVL